MENKYLVVYEHRHGVDVYVVASEEFPNEDDVITALQLEYNQDAPGEIVSIRPMPEPIFI